MITRACKGHFEDYSFGTAQSSPQNYYSSTPKPDSSVGLRPFAFPRPDYSEKGGEMLAPVCCSGGTSFSFRIVCKSF
ncbi:unnamed protein product [Linum trigynum]|uniref:Uncharacterized protein n=1 Tax=Linum trigynum TaxID=586398 RepID=A0AAV2FQC7_9ROSI